MHRTTIILDDELEIRLKKRARKEGKSLTELIQDFLRAGLNKVLPGRKKATLSLPSFSLGEAKVDPSDRSRLWDIMEER